MLSWVLWADFLTTLNVHNFSNKTLSLIPDFWSQPMSTSTFSLNLGAGPKTWMIGRSLSNVGAILSEQNNKKVSRAVLKEATTIQASAIMQCAVVSLGHS